MDNFQFKLLRQTRQNSLKVINSLSPEQIFKTPLGFSNSILWNAGHMIVSHQLLCYARAGLQMRLEDSIIERYRKGTSPAGSETIDDIEFVKSKMIETPEIMLQDLEDGLFENYTTYQTSYGVELTSIDDALSFNNVHEGMHFGNILSLRKAISASKPI